MNRESRIDLSLWPGVAAVVSLSETFQPVSNLAGIVHAGRFSHPDFSIFYDFHRGLCASVMDEASSLGESRGLSISRVWMENLP